LAASLSHRGATVDFTFVRRAYGEYWLPQWHGLRNSVENQLCLYLSPFAQEGVVERALCSAPLLGTGGELEAAMIRSLSPRVAALRSSYGHPFDHLPARHSLAARVRAGVPNRLKLSAAAARSRVQGVKPDPIVERLVSRHRLLAEGWGRLQALDLPVIWDRFTSSRDRAVQALSVAASLRLMEGRVRW
jgi:hypothetical protein